jgi:hypothetical protein
LKCGEITAANKWQSVFAVPGCVMKLLVYIVAGNEYSVSVKLNQARVSAYVHRHLMLAVMRGSNLLS